MEEFIEQSSRLLQHLAQVREDGSLPDIPWEKAAVYSLARKREEGKLYCAYCPPQQEGPASFHFRPFSETPFQQIFENRSSLKVKNQRFGEVQPLPDQHVDENLLIVPLALLTGPVGLLVIPLPDEDRMVKIYNGQLSTLGNEVLACLKEELSQVFAGEQLRHFSEASQLVKAFVEAVAKWMSPCKYRIEKETGLRDTQDWAASVLGECIDEPLELKLMAGDKYYKAAFRLPTFQYPVNKEPDYIHQLGYFKIRKLRLCRELEWEFARIYDYWRVLRSPRAIASRRITEKFIAIADEIKKKLESEFQALEEIPLSGSFVPETAPPSDPPFCFYRENSVWVVRFNGEPVRFHPRSAQGMEAIRILLSTPEEYFAPLELDELLEDGGFNYKKKPKEQADEELDKVNEQVLIEDLNSYRQMEGKLKNSPPDQQAAYWQYRMEIVRSLLTHGKKKAYILEWKRCKNMLEKLSIFLEDSNFIDATSSVLTPARKSGNEKHRKDSIVKGIKNAIGSMDKEEDIRQYLEVVIVLRNRVNHKPFIYLPELYKGLPYEEIEWKTLAGE